MQAMSSRPSSRSPAARIMAWLLSRALYGVVIYLTAPAARRVILRAAASLLRWEQSMLAIRDPPAVAFTPEQRVERRGLALVNVGGKSGS